jgi:DNA-directed RNA polymerase sigma subunit (sigma70/sigma32)
MTTTIDELRALQQADHERRHNRTDRDVDIIHLRYVDGLTLDAIGRRYGLTRQRVMQIVHKPL